jgi:hypothetical protein
MQMQGATHGLPRFNLSLPSKYLSHEAMTIHATGPASLHEHLCTLGIIPMYMKCAFSRDLLETFASGVRLLSGKNLLNKHMRTTSQQSQCLTSNHERHLTT